MIIPDVNLLIYAYDTTSPDNEKASAWWRKCMSGVEAVGLAPVVIFGFLRITTNSRSFQNPLSISEAFEIVRSWLAQPVVQVIEPTAGHIERTMKLLEALGTGGNLVTDAQIASLALEYGATVHTADADFLRFRGLSWFNPMTGTGGK